MTIYPDRNQSLKIVYKVCGIKLRFKDLGFKKNMSDTCFIKTLIIFLDLQIQGIKETIGGE